MNSAWSVAGQKCKIVGDSHTLTRLRPDSDHNLVNTTSEPGLFVSEPAMWDEGEPDVVDRKGETEKIVVYETDDKGDGMMFPIHQGCIDLIERMCRVRQGQAEVSKCKPRSLREFCYALRDQRQFNHKQRRKPETDHYYGNLGGIEWPHDFYGARQFWSDEWENEPGWEVCRRTYLGDLW